MSSDIVPVEGFDAECKAFIERGLWDGKRTLTPGVGLAFASEDRGIVSACFYHNYDPDTEVIEISIYSLDRSWTNKQNVSAIFDFPFLRLDVRMLVARHTEHNKRVRRIWRALGASEYIIPELRGPGEAEAIATMLRDDWLKSPFRVKGEADGQG